jgi:hypothetical protein
MFIVSCVCVIRTHTHCDFRQDRILELQSSPKSYTKWEVEEVCKGDQLSPTPYSMRCCSKLTEHLEAKENQRLLGFRSSQFLFSVRVKVTMPAIKESLINLSSCYSLAAPVLFTFYQDEWK